jgi:hypothetical protein
MSDRSQPCEPSAVAPLEATIRLHPGSVQTYSRKAWPQPGLNRDRPSVSQRPRFAREPPRRQRRETGAVPGSARGHRSLPRHLHAHQQSLRKIPRREWRLPSSRSQRVSHSLAFASPRRPSRPRSSPRVPPGVNVLSHVWFRPFTARRVSAVLQMRRQAGAASGSPRRGATNVVQDRSTAGAVPPGKRNGREHQDLRRRHLLAREIGDDPHTPKNRRAQAVLTPFGVPLAISSIRSAVFSASPPDDRGYGGCTCETAEVRRQTRGISLLVVSMGGCD